MSDELTTGAGIQTSWSIQLVLEELESWRSSSYRERRRGWVNSNSYFLNFWRAFATVGTAVLTAITSAAFKLHPIAETLLVAGLAVASYLALWGVEYSIKWAWQAPAALEVESQDKVEGALQQVRIAEGSITFWEQQTEHFRSVYLKAFTELSSCRAECDSLRGQLTSLENAQSHANPAMQ